MRRINILAQIDGGDPGAALVNNMARNAITGKVTLST